MASCGHLRPDRNLTLPVKAPFGDATLGFVGLIQLMGKLAEDAEEIFGGLAEEVCCILVTTPPSAHESIWVMSYK